jgi:hypothetical protein
MVLCHSVEPSPRKIDSLLADYVSLRLLYNSNIHYANKIQLLDPILMTFDQFQALTLSSFEIHFNTVLPCTCMSLD